MAPPVVYWAEQPWGSAPDVIRHFASQDYGGIDIEDRLGEVTHPVLVLGGRYDRTCAVGASQDITQRLPNAELVVFEDSAHMMFAEEQDASSQRSAGSSTASR